MQVVGQLLMQFNIVSLDLITEAQTTTVNIEGVDWYLMLIYFSPQINCG